MKITRVILLSLLTVTMFFTLFGCQQDNSPKAEVEIINPWLRDLPEGSLNSAGFLTIINNTDKSLVLEDVSLDWARHAMIHKSSIVDGMAKMEHQNELTIEQQLEFAPGGLHIMIMGLKEPLDPTQSYNIRLHFKGREPLVVGFKVGQTRK